MSKEVTTTQGSEVLDQSAMLGAFGDVSLSATDVVIPKILAMQGMSKLALEGKASVGQFVDSISNEVVGSIDEPLEFIPFHLTKTWIVSKWNGQKYKFSHIEDVTPQNENRQWEEEIDGEKIKNEKSFNFYCLRPEDMSLPCVISFKGTSQRTGRELATQMYVKNRAVGKVPPAMVMTLSGSRETKEGNTFIVLKTATSRSSTTEEIMACLDWFKAVGGYKVDDSDLAPEQAAAPQQAEEQPAF